MRKRSNKDVVRQFLAARGLIVVRYDTEARARRMHDVTAITRERRLLLNHCEACQILSVLEATEKIPGDLAELGVAFGASAKLIADHAHGRMLHLFDTFEGLPEPTEKDNPKFFAGDFRSDFEEITRYLSDQNVRFHKGLFPETSGPVEDKVFSFVHLDVDLYESTRSGLEFFYPRMSPGGILISHDYVTADGVNQAFAEFFADKPEPVIELTGYQCMVVKLASAANSLRGTLA